MIRLSDAATLHHADCREAIKRIPSDSLDSCVTDPPYALVSTLKRFGGPNAAPAKGNDAYMRASSGFMGKTWDTGETAMAVEFWAEVYRVLKPGAFVAAFGASRGYHRMACAIEDAGFEIRDSLMWVYGTGFPKSHDVSRSLDKMAGAERPITHTTKSGGFARIMETNADAGFRPDNYYEEGNAFRSNEPISAAAQEWSGWGTALKPAFEPIVPARKPLSEPTVAANVLRWRTGALNIDGCRIGSEVAGWGGKGAGGNTWNESNNGLGKDGAARPVVGRWPANIVTDGSDEVVGAFPTLGKSTGGRAFVGARGGNVYQTAQGGTEKRDPGYGDSGSASRFFYSAKASKQDRNGSKHPTVKPISLMEWLCTLITPPGGTILDPFAGSGTTGAAARNKGFKVVLVEREAEYVEDIKARFGFIASPPLAPLDPLPVMSLAPPPY